MIEQTIVQIRRVKKLCQYGVSPADVQGILTQIESDVIALGGYIANIEATSEEHESQLVKLRAVMEEAHRRELGNCLGTDNCGCGCCK